jgi:SAM-dependent methyltransferase
MTVADLGAGTGYFIPHLSPAVGPTGRVLALDVEPNMVAHMQERIAEANLDNVEARQVPTDAPGLGPATVDRILIVDTWHHIADRGAYAAHLRDALRPGGFVLVVDFKADAPHGPPPAMRLPPARVAAELQEAGLQTEIDTDALAYQYLIVGRGREGG